MGLPSEAPVKRRNYPAIIGVTAAAVCLLVAGVALPFYLMHRTQPAVRPTPSPVSTNPEDALNRPRPGTLPGGTPPPLPLHTRDPEAAVSGGEAAGGGGEIREAHP